jgi:hypothetical protein
LTLVGTLGLDEQGIHRALARFSCTLEEDAELLPTLSGFAANSVRFRSPALPPLSLSLSLSVWLSVCCARALALALLLALSVLASRPLFLVY